jgi:hypothetical protein
MASVFFKLTGYFAPWVHLQVRGRTMREARHTYEAITQHRNSSCIEALDSTY